MLESRRVVVTRDAQDIVHGFSATCPHQGCVVDSIKDGVIECPCHGSQFDVRTGAVLHGPAKRALRAVPVVVRDGNVFTA